MATLSMFYGIIISMFFRDNRQHKLPHIHVTYQDDTAIISIPDGEYADELMADWTLAVDGKNIYKIEPLR
jgi:hypothetical protein